MGKKIVFAKPINFMYRNDSTFVTHAIHEKFLPKILL